MVNETGFSRNRRLEFEERLNSFHYFFFRKDKKRIEL